MTPLLYLPAAAPLAVALTAAAVRRSVAAWASVVAAAAILGTGIYLTPQVTGARVLAAGPLRADALTAYMLIVVGAVATVACWAGVYYLRAEGVAHPASRGVALRYLILVQLFLAAMSLALLADNLGLLWVAIEATTIVTAFLVGHRRTRASVEAAWKYVVLCSVGIAIAFLGAVCVYAAAVTAGAHGTAALDWSYLHTHTAGLDPAVMRLAAGLIILGFGTKAGLAPMHAWLPDAHSQAPAPVSALMSGVLLSVALYAIVRYKIITDAVLGPTYTRTLLLAAALASLTVAAVLLIAQRDYKRMLAYSSIEHMGLIAAAVAIGGHLALAAALLHMLGHGLAKSVAFCGAGQILHTTGTTNIGDVRGLYARAPALATVFGLSLVALLGLPPFSLFASELAVARDGATAGYGWITAAAFTLVAVSFAAIIGHGTAMLLGPAGTEGPAGRTRPAALIPLVAGLTAATLLGLSLGPLADLLDAAASIAGGY